MATRHIVFAALIAASSAIMQRNSAVATDSVTKNTGDQTAVTASPQVPNGPNLFGACCYVDATGVPTCAVVTQQECSFVGGSYQGDGTTCTPNPCSPVPHVECTSVAGQCCAGRPNINDPAYTALPNLITVGTASPQAAGGSVVNIFGLNNPNGGPFNTDFGAPIYSHPSWSESKLGSVFGVELDATGNIYVTGTTCYYVDTPGTSGSGSLGDIYKIDANTGNAALWTTLPNANNTGLGNICYDCDHSQFFVSNMEDGNIYRLDSSGTVLSTFDYGTPDDPTNTYPPLGDRIWAVQAHNGRLYFSVWNEDAGNPSTTVANEIWSIALDGTGNFSGVPQLEVSIPPIFTDYSNPVADMRFTPTGTMLLAERGMSSPTDPVPHQSRLLEYKCEAVAGSTAMWVPSGNNFSIGIGSGTNTAGGVDMDYSPGGRVYSTGDALQLGPQDIYGMQGTPVIGGNVGNSILVDFNGIIAGQDKTMIGSVAMPCHVDEPCLNVHNMKVLCPTPTNPCFTATFTITNKSGFDVKYITIPLHPDPNSPITVNPNVINLVVQDGHVMPDGGSTTITLTICNANPGDEFCLEIGMLTPSFVQCCFEDVCFTMPICDCGQLTNQQFGDISCPTGVVSFNFDFTLENLSTFAADSVIFIPLKGEQAIFAKDFFFLPPLQPGGTLPMRVDVENAVPGETFCFYVLLQHPALVPGDCCCAFEKCIEVPACVQPNRQSCPGNTNLDASVNVTDMLAVISGWGPCPGGCPPPCPADLNHDCAVNVADLLIVLNNWGPCPFGN